MEGSNLPFKPGDSAEARSFLPGYRGAWFRCKIKEISKRKELIGHVSEYIDFPDEKVKWTKLYQVPHHLSKKMGEKHRKLVLRPKYPPVIKENEMPNATDISEVTVIVNGAWKVGDLVDWWTDGCFWSGKIIELSGDDRAKIVLHPPPLGEGATYDGLLKDVRPSLDWSPEYGWTIPAQDSPPCAWIVEPNPINEGLVDQQNTVQEEAKETLEGSTNEEVENERIITEETESTETDTPDRLKHATGSLKLTLSDPLVASVMDLEECLNKVKRLKAILQHGIESPDASKGQWMYEHGSPSTTK